MFLLCMRTGFSLNLILAVACLFMGLRKIVIYLLYVGSPPFNFKRIPLWSWYSSLLMCFTQISLISHIRKRLGLRRKRQKKIKCNLFWGGMLIPDGVFYFFKVGWNYYENLCAQNLFWHEKIPVGKCGFLDEWCV